MFKLISISLYIFLLNFINCDGNNWIKDEELVIQALATTPNDSIIIPTQDSIASSSSEVVSSDLSISPESTTITTTTSTTTTEKPPPKQFGCSSLLWSSDAMFCWTRCNTSSTSKFFNTWCFTTNVTVDIDKAPKVQCDADDKCQPQWKCKSSCGLFSPHWDKEEADQPAAPDDAPLKDSLTR